MRKVLFSTLALLLAGVCSAQYPQQPLDLTVQVTEPGFQVFQFPKNQIPRIDGEFSDWAIVPDSAKEKREQAISKALQEIESYWRGVNE